jgi:hypothetical protein
MNISKKPKLILLSLSVLLALGAILVFAMGKVSLNSIISGPPLQYESIVSLCKEVQKLDGENPALLQAKFDNHRIRVTGYVWDISKDDTEDKYSVDLIPSGEGYGHIEHGVTAMDLSRGKVLQLKKGQLVTVEGLFQSLDTTFGYPCVFIYNADINY